MKLTWILHLSHSGIFSLCLSIYIYKNGESVCLLFVRVLYWDEFVWSNVKQTNVSDWSCAKQSSKERTSTHLMASVCL